MRFDRLDLNLLVALDVLIEEKSVSAASRRLNLTQPAVSGALHRLREYFKDDLLLQSGRQMFLTPKAEELSAPVREALMLIRAKITIPSGFDPATAQRQFAVIASDFAYNILLADAICAAAVIAPGVTFEVQATDVHALERLERGEIDLVITVSNYLAENHPRQPLFQDRHAVICWAGGAHCNGIDEKSFFAAGHAVAYFGAEKHPAFTEQYFLQQGSNRRIELKVPNFAALPQAVLGTDRLATMYRRHAEYYARFLPIVVHEAPMPMPDIVEEAQWHSIRDSDEGLRWLRRLLQVQASLLTEPLAVTAYG